LQKRLTFELISNCGPNPSVNVLASNDASLPSRHLLTLIVERLLFGSLYGCFGSDLSWSANGSGRPGAELQKTRWKRSFGVVTVPMLWQM